MFLLRKSFKTTKISGIIFFFLFLMLSADAQNKKLENAVGNLQEYAKYFPQQKIYLHLDKGYYYPGENIWFKAYLVNAATHLPDNLSHNLFVELYDTSNENIALRVLNLENGLAWGDIQIPDSIPDGNYVVRAYTTWMLNFDSDNIYEAPVYIENLEEENYISWLEARKNRRFNRNLESKKEDFHFNFYPEGGNIIGGTLNRIAFKANNKTGKGVDINGRLKNQNGDVITDFESIHNGMGYFEFMPVSGQKYYASIAFPDGREDMFKLPRVYRSGYVLRVENHPDSDNIHVKINGEGDVDDHLALIALTRGDVRFFEEFSLVDDKARLDIPKDKFDAGISQITFFDNNAVPLAERLVFIDKQDYLNIDMEGLSVEEENPDRLTIIIADTEGDTVEGSFSMSIAKVSENTNIHNSIMSEFLINSDLKGYIEDPEFYFDSNNDKASEALDVLMMTHGWRRFDLESIASGKFPEIRYDILTGLSIGGKVTTPSARRGVDFANVEMLVHGDDESSYRTEADKDGNFIFSDLEYYGLFKAEFVASRTDFGTNLRIEIESADLAEKKYSFNIHTREHKITERGNDWVRVSRRPSGEEMTDDSRFDPSESSDVHYLVNPDQVVYMEDIKIPYSTLGEVLRGRITGLRFDRTGQLLLRGPTSIMGSSQPAFFIDQIPIDQSRFLLMDPNDIDRVEVFKGTSAAILGVRGANGALLAYSKRGGVENIRSFIYKFMGYHVPREFYVQSEEELERERKPDEYQTLLWEPIVEANEKGKITIDFFKNLDPGKYLIRIEGLDFEGSLGSLNKVIEIPEFQSAN